MVHIRPTNLAMRAALFWLFWLLASDARPTVKGGSPDRHIIIGRQLGGESGEGTKPTIPGGKDDKAAGLNESEIPDIISGDKPETETEIESGSKSPGSLDSDSKPPAKKPKADAAEKDQAPPKPSDSKSAAGEIPAKKSGNKTAAGNDDWLERELASATEEERQGIRLLKTLAELGASVLEAAESASLVKDAKGGSGPGGAKDPSGPGGKGPSGPGGADGPSGPGGKGPSGAGGDEDA